MILADFPAPTKDEAWPVLLTIFALLGIVAKVMEIWKHSRGTKVHGTIHSEPVPQHAEQSDLDALTKTVNSLREEITAQFRAAQTAGEQRVAAITSDVNDQMRVIGVSVAELGKNITAAMVDNAKQGAEIDALKSADFRHDGAIQRIQQNISDLMGHPRKRTS